VSSGPADALLVLALLLNFYNLATTRLRALVIAVSAQGLLLAALYPLTHGHAQGIGTWARLLVLAAALAVVKGWVIPRMLLRALRELDVLRRIESYVGFVPTLLLGAVGTALAIVYARTLPLAQAHTSTLIVPASLATVLTGFLLLTTRRKALTQAVGYLVLENGIFLFGLLLVEAMPMMVEIGALLDLMVGVFVMGIVIHHVTREFAVAGEEEPMTALRE
jgi:hydrogenase-4 component E